MDQKSAGIGVVISGLLTIISVSEVQQIISIIAGFFAIVSAVLAARYYYHAGTEKKRLNEKNISITDRDDN